MYQLFPAAEPNHAPRMRGGSIRQTRRRQIVIFCIFSTTLRRIARSIPWATLTVSEKKQLQAALEALESDIALARSITNIEPAQKPRRKRAHKDDPEKE